MEEIFDEMADSETQIKVVKIALILSMLGKILNNPASFIAIIINERNTESFIDSIKTMANTVDKLDPLVNVPILTKQNGYEVLFTVTESMPFVVEIDNTLNECGISTEVEGKRIVEHLREILTA